jgi:hypothetical protein
MLSLYAYRQMDKIDWLPFIKAAFERNPVCFLDLNGKSVSEVYSIIKNLDNQSIYDGNRLALPDEVWNYQRGDGIEKAILMADFIIKKEGSFPVIIKIDHRDVTVDHHNKKYIFKSGKSLKKTIEVSENNYKIE